MINNKMSFSGFRANATVKIALTLHCYYCEIIYQQIQFRSFCDVSLVKK